MSNTELSSPPVPPLVEGDRLTRDEFERRYDAMPGVKKAELIEGVVHMPSPSDGTATPRRTSTSTTGSGRTGSRPRAPQAGDNGSVRLDLANVPQPDAALIILPSHGGKRASAPTTTSKGAPELVVEVAASSASLRPERQAPRLPAQRRPRVRRLARREAAGRLVRPPRQEVRPRSPRLRRACCAARRSPACGSTRRP